jgi:hypothetical protein
MLESPGAIGLALGIQALKDLVKLKGKKLL